MIRIERIIEMIKITVELNQVWALVLASLILLTIAFFIISKLEEKVFDHIHHQRQCRLNHLEHLQVSKIDLSDWSSFGKSSW